MAKVRAHVVVDGRVQGVYFRDTMRRLASGHNVTGWVANLPDGRVEALIEGEHDDVQAVVDWCHQGPPAAYVSNVEVVWTAFKGEFASFFVKW